MCGCVCTSSAASDVYKRQVNVELNEVINVCLSACISLWYVCMQNDILFNKRRGKGANVRYGWKGNVCEGRG